MAAEMSAFYADKKPGAEEVLQGGLYAVQEDEVFHRSVVQTQRTLVTNAAELVVTRAPVTAAPSERIWLKMFLKLAGSRTF